MADILIEFAQIAGAVAFCFSTLVVFDWWRENHRRQFERSEYRAEPRCWACGRPDPEGECMGCALDLLPFRELLERDRETAEYEAFAAVAAAVPPEQRARTWDEHAHEAVRPPR